ncbi:type II CAAX endopeptidase family protein [uncultured Lacinutrix sp.]|uniref:CPBP family intramembrane glutamic endopeptidase n=1 Tax=uncultured Lacinutrix sp. TaxID=574032 RepID=UPI00261C712F|nr:type II CAAX endopeptidase family protein [uncultured Lacinutrix sp.]
MSLVCKRCKAIFDTEIKFCSECGESISKHIEIKKIETINLIIGFYATMLVFIAVVYFIGDVYPENFVADLVIEITFALIIIGFSILDFKNILKLYSVQSINWRLLLIVIVTPIISSLIVYYFIEFVTFLMDNGESSNYFVSYLYLEHPLFWAIFFVAIMPPIFEELAFRGFLFNKLREITSSNLTIIATAFLFALIHFSFISFLWIFPFGLLLGYLRSKYNTIWLGVIVHFLHNLIVLMLDYYDYYKMLE